MAESTEDITNREMCKQFNKPNGDIKRALHYAIKQLEMDSKFSVSLLKFKKSNGDSSNQFNEWDIFCDILPYRKTCYAFTCLFQPGIKLLTDYLDDRNDSNATPEEEIALKRLIDTFENIDDISRRLQTRCEPKMIGEVWPTQLSHHLLSKLSGNQNYAIHSVWNHPIDRTKKCMCCNETIHGEFRKNDIGNRHVWYGYVDILIGENTIVVDTSNEEASTEEEDYLIDNTTINEVTVIGSHAKQVIAETILSAFLQKKQRSKQIENYLIPTIGMTRFEVNFFFYDAKRDFLLKTSYPRPLFNLDSPKLSPVALLALWLTINYPTTCSGLTDKIVATDFKADFLKDFDDDVKAIYENDLRYGLNDEPWQEPWNPDYETEGKPVDGIYGRLETA